MAATTIGLGQDAVIGIGAAGETVPAGTFVAIGGRTSGSLSISSNEVDTSNLDDGEFTSFLLGRTTITLDVESRFDPVGDSGGVGLAEELAGDLDDGGGNFKALRAFQVAPRGTGSGAPQYSFDGYITSYDISMDDDGAVNVSFSVRATGASTGATAPTFGAAV